MSDLTLFGLGEEYFKVLSKIEANDGVLTDELEQEMNAAMTAVINKQDAYLAVMEQFDSDTSKLDEWIDRLKTKKAAINSNKERLETRLKEFMELTGIDSLEGTLGKVKLMSSQKVPDWVTIENVGEDYKKIDVVISLKKRELLNDIKSGKVTNIPLEETKHLRIFKPRQSKDKE